MSNRYYTKAQSHFGYITTGKEWMLVKGQTEYKGPYHYYGDHELVLTGAKKTKVSKVLIPYRNITIDKATVLYDKITTIDLSQFITPIAKRVLPTAADKKEGYMIRYFLKKKNDLTSQIIEIDVNQFQRVKEKHGTYINGFLYDKISLRWKITGPINDEYIDNSKEQIKVFGITDTNRRTIFSKNQQFPGIVNLLRDLTEHSEYSAHDTQDKASMQQSLLHSSGNEFVFGDGAEFRGYYHIHPTLGTFTGKKHVTGSSQSRLYSFAEYSMLKAGKRII